jgi:inner membrane protein
MPSPVAHSLIGAALGAAVLLPDTEGDSLARRLWRNRVALVGCVVLANAPDVDFLPGLWAGDLNAFHHGTTHSVAWALLVSAGLWLVARGASDKVRPVLLLFLFAILSSHLLADYLCADASPPRGLPLAWPFQRAWHVSPVSLFAAMEKATLRQVFSLANLPAALWEATVGMAFLGLACWHAQRRPQARAGAACDAAEPLA